MASASGLSPSNDAHQESVVASLARCLEAFDDFSLAVVDFSLEEAENLYLSRINDEHGRLRVWEKNHVLNHDGRDSLDNVLSKDPEVKSIVLELLQNLCDDLKAGVLLAQAMTESTVGFAPRPEVLLEFDSDSSSHSSSSSGSDISPSKEFKQLLLAISASLRSLFRVSPLFKRGKLSAQYIRSNGGGDSHFAIWDQKHVEEKLKLWASDVGGCCHISVGDGWILPERLAAANSRRREQLNFWREHPEQTDLKIALGSAQRLREAPMGQIVREQTQPPSQIHRSQSAAITSASRPTSHSFSTVAQTTLNDNETTSGPPETIYTPSTMGGQRARVPPLPKAPSGSSKFQCSYCFRWLDCSKIRNRELWKKHVFRDLRPYVCTFKFCPNPTKLYASRHEWLYHEIQMHRRRWICGGNCNKAFKTRALVESHMKEVHPMDFLEPQLPVLVDMCERPESLSQQIKCPLCSKEIYLSDLGSHTGSHLEDLALFVSPMQYDNSSENGSSASDKAVGAVEQIDQSEWDKLSDFEFSSDLVPETNLAKQNSAAFMEFVEKSQDKALPIQSWLDLNPSQDHYLSPNRLHDATLSIHPSGRRCIPPGPLPTLSSPGERKPYQCTLRCGASFNNEYDWIKHEEINYPQEGWICDMEPFITNADSHDLSCLYCGLSNPASDHIDQEHSDTVPCHQKSLGDAEKLFYAKEDFRNHFSQYHPGVQCEIYLEESHFLVQSKFPKGCGFCLYQFKNWEDRLNHLSVHFSMGKDIEDWQESEGLNLNPSTSLQQQNESMLALDSLVTDNLKIEVLSETIVYPPSLTSEEPEENRIQLPCFSLKSNTQSQEFFGRLETLELIDQEVFSSDRNDSRCVMISGKGGVGKSQVAIEYAHSRKTRFNAIFWLYSNDKMILAQQFAGIAAQLGLEEPGSEGKDLAASCDLVQEWLSNPVKTTGISQSNLEKATWLMIFDDVDDFAVLEDYWPLSEHGAIIVTGRTPLANRSINIRLLEIDLQPFTLKESAVFLETLTRQRFHDKGSRSLDIITERLGGLPLAITLIADIISDLEISTYAELLMIYDLASTQQRIGTQEALTISKHQLFPATLWALERLPADALALFQVISLFDPDRIPEIILTEGCANVDLPGYPSSSADYDGARNYLSRHSLIKVKKELGEICVHRVVQDTVRTELDSHQFNKTFHAALVLISKVWPFQTFKERHFVARMDKCAEMFPCVVRLRNCFVAERARVDCFQPDHSFAELINDAGWYLLERGFTQESKSYFELVQEICEKSDTATINVADTLRLSHNNQSTAAAETNDLKGCLSHALTWLEMTHNRKTASGQVLVDYELGIVYNETGVAYALNNMWDIAVEYFIKSMETFEELENYDEIMQGWPAPNLGLVYWIQGRYNDAEKVLTRILDIHATRLGLDDTKSFKTGKILHALGNLYASQDLQDKSLDFHTRAFKQYMITLGPRHHRTADVCHRLSMHQMRLGNYLEAEIRMDQALKVFSGNPRYTPEFARTTFKKAQLLQVLGRIEDSANLKTIALTLLNALTKDSRSAYRVGEEDYDSLVAFWSR